ncbi:MAG: molecular chaperone TorD family protein [Ignavibacteriales bacterium]|nr:molecular chaperone TorD family protein [Ignavibacteriales bacterium]
MNTLANVYDTFSRIFLYPKEDYRLRIAALSSFQVSTNENEKNILGLISRFQTETQELSIDDFEELYTQTFDINPVASLELGWHLYEETYERGSFLVTMRELLRTHSIEESSELPDHVTHVLLLLARMEKTEADAFAATYVFPALKKILDGFDGKQNPYEHLLRALFLFIPPDLKIHHIGELAYEHE